MKPMAVGELVKLSGVGALVPMGGAVGDGVYPTQSGTMVKVAFGPSR